MDKICRCLFQTTFAKKNLGYGFHIAIKIIIQNKKKKLLTIHTPINLFENQK